MASKDDVVRTAIRAAMGGPTTLTPSALFKRVKRDHPEITREQFDDGVSSLLKDSILTQVGSKLKRK